MLLAGGGLGNAVLFSIAKALRDNGNRVIYFAGYRKGEDLFKREEIEAATDQVIWSTDVGAEIAPGGRRTRTSAATSCRRWSPTHGTLGEPLVPLSERRRGSSPSARTA